MYLASYVLDPRLELKIFNRHGRESCGVGWHGSQRVYKYLYLNI